MPISSNLIDRTRLLFKIFADKTWASIKKIFTRYPDLLFATVAAIAIVALSNWQFWFSLVKAMNLSGLADGAFVFALSLLFSWLYAVLLLLMPGRRAMRVTGICLVILAAACAYFVDNFGIGIDLDMVRNVVETDTTEALGLFSLRLVIYILVLGVVPAWLLWKIPLSPIPFKRYFLHRLAFLVGGAMVVFVVMSPHSGKFASFLREHKPLRYMMNPGNLLYASWSLMKQESVSSTSQLIDVDGKVSRTSSPVGSKPLLIFLVIGETARAADFELLGHARATNPKLSAVGDLYLFNQMSSCGTSTAISLPCIFSGLGREKFDVATATSRTNLLDTLTNGGLAVEWRDNNSGCKGICARVSALAMPAESAPSLCQEDYCHDEILLAGLSKAIIDNPTDQLKVLHQIGSHGPAYWRRYPASFEYFKPTCRTTNLGACSLDEIHNAYDNTIRYTDHVLSKMIDMLRDLSDRYDTVFLYVSDHGESLGENNLYLHGAPYFFAPDMQTRIPMLLWMSEGFRQRKSIQSSCVRSLQNLSFSHDNVYHTVLGMADIKNAVYDSKLDMLNGCRPL